MKAHILSLLTVIHFLSIGGLALYGLHLKGRGGGGNKHQPLLPAGSKLVPLAQKTVQSVKNASTTISTSDTLQLSI
ncbi:MAG: hypothetical protein V2B19_19995 [Pseudomonadota bacterium]